MCYALPFSFEMHCVIEEHSSDIDIEILYRFQKVEDPIKYQYWQKCLLPFLIEQRT